MIPSLQEMAMLRISRTCRQSRCFADQHGQEAAATEDRYDSHICVIDARYNALVRFRSSAWAREQGPGFPLRWQVRTSLPEPSAQIPRSNSVRLTRTQELELMRLSGRKFELSWRGDEVGVAVRVPIYPPTNRG